MIRSGLFGNGGDAVALLGVEVRAEVVAGHACAVVRQRYRNDERNPIEAVYTFPLPSKGVLTGFSMTVGGRRMEGEVQEREEAFRTYDDAITSGDGAALLEQERPNVFTANVGNLLPGEETIIEVQYIEPVLADEGALRWSIPMLVAPRYIPGLPTGDRTAHGVADPTDRVPDADRISPPIGAVSYGLALDLTFDLGVVLDVESPSHTVVVRHEGTKARVTFAQKDVPLDRDVVVTAFARSSSRSADRPLASSVCHRTGGKPGAFALMLVPDLAAAKPGVGAHEARQSVVFVLDRSGSMGGSSMPEARTALRLCLRQLREGDRFGILAFDDSIESFAPTMVPFTQSTLQQADQWLSAIEARGGTELLAPMLAAAELLEPRDDRRPPGTNADGIVVLLTDGEVGNEDEILEKFMAARKRLRVYSFGIGTNVSDALLHALGDKTGGMVEMIYPGERVDEKVVAQFARATAPRVTDVTIKTRGVELSELAPAEARPLVDSEPYCIFGTYEKPGHGVVEVRGLRDGEAFYAEFPIELAEECERPVVATLWAQARIRDLERSNLTGRRHDAMKDRIVKLAIEHGVSSKYTSFVVVEKRTGDRRATAQPETRVVPVNAPAGWALFQSGQSGGTAARTRHMRMAPMMSAARSMPTGAAPAMPPAMPAPMSLRRPAAGMPSPAQGYGGGGAPSTIPPARAYHAGAFADESDDLSLVAQGRMASRDGFAAPPSPEPLPSGDPVVGVLARQRASGLWEEPGRDTLEASLSALLALLRLGLSTAHPIYGAQLKKALDALLAHIEARNAGQPSPAESRVLELAFGVAWLLASGRRTRHVIEDAVRGGPDLGALAAAFGNEPAVRAHVERLASA